MGFERNVIKLVPSKYKHVVREWIQLEEPLPEESWPDANEPEAFVVRELVRLDPVLVAETYDLWREEHGHPPTKLAKVIGKGVHRIWSRVLR